MTVCPSELFPFLLIIYLLLAFQLAFQIIVYLWLPETKMEKEQQQNDEIDQGEIDFFHYSVFLCDLRVDSEKNNT